MANKETSDRVSSLAARVLRGHKPTEAEIMILAASALSQDEKRRLMDETDVPKEDMLTSDIYPGTKLDGGLFEEHNDEMPF